MEDKFQRKYRIPSNRASWHNYNDGAYFITICTARHIHYFGEISDGEMHLSEIGNIMENNLKNISIHYPYAEIPLFVIMPNHIHAIIFIDSNKVPDKSWHATEETRHAASLQRGEASKGMLMRKTADAQSCLSVAIGGMKSAITKFAHSKNLTFGWQSCFYDHIIRSQAEMNNIAEYIKTNVAKWDLDKLNTHL